MYAALLPSVDSAVQTFLVAHRDSWQTTGARTLTWAGSIVVVAPVVLAVAWWVVAHGRSSRVALILAAALAGAVVTSNALKVIVDRPRPPAATSVADAAGSSFPSGHTVNAVAGYGLAAFALGGSWRSRLRWAAWGLAGVMAMVVAYTRLYLGVHWLTDVLGGAALGAAWVGIGVALLRTRTGGATAPT
ncbi:MAG: phosphatase PAP2 family protein [Actinomycetota bacterium]